MQIFRAKVKHTTLFIFRNSFCTLKKHTEEVFPAENVYNRYRCISGNLRNQGKKVSRRERR